MVTYLEHYDGFAEELTALSSDEVLEQVCFIVKTSLLLNTIDRTQGPHWIETRSWCRGEWRSFCRITSITEWIANWWLTNARQWKSQLLVRWKPPMVIKEDLNAMFFKIAKSSYLYLWAQDKLYFNGVRLERLNKYVILPFICQMEWIKKYSSLTSYNEMGIHGRLLNFITMDADYLTGFLNITSGLVM